MKFIKKKCKIPHLGWNNLLQAVTSAELVPRQAKDMGGKKVKKELAGSWQQ